MKPFGCKHAHFMAEQMHFDAKKTVRREVQEIR